MLAILRERGRAPVRAAAEFAMGEPSDEDREMWARVRDAVLIRANASRWGHLVGGILIEIPDAQSAAIAGELADGFSGERTQELVASIREKLPPAPPSGWFAKTGSCSTKQDYPPTPCYSAEEILMTLVGSEKVRRAFAECRAKCLFIREWDARVNHANEVRVFCRENRVVGVSQQFCYDVVEIMHYLGPKEVVAACQRLWDECRQGLRPERRFDYECTFDAFVTTDDDGGLRAHLIEINSEALGWGPAGSSLFEWKTRPPPRVGEAPVFIIRE